MNECLHSELQACPVGEECRNLEGSYQCVSSQRLNHTDEGTAGVLRTHERDKESRSREVDGLQTSGTPAIFP